MKPRKVAIKEVNVTHVVYEYIVKHYFSSSYVSQISSLRSFVNVITSALYFYDFLGD